MGRKKILNLNSGKQLCFASGALGLACAASLAGISLDYAHARAGADAGQGVATTIDNTWVEVSTSGNISMSIVPTPESSLVASKGTVNVKTNSANGYQLYAAGSLYREGDTNRYAGLYLDGSTTGGDNSVISATPATADPAALGLNEWGYALADATGFSTHELYDAAINSEVVTSSVEMNNLKWKGLKGDYQHILTSTNSNSTMETTGENTDVYYGVRINNARANGNYRNTIIYTAFVDATSAIVMNPAVLDLTEANTSTTVTFTTGHQSSSQPVTASQISVELFDSNNASAQIASCDANSITVLDGHDGTYGHPLKFTCSITRLAGAVSSITPNYDVIVRVDGDNNGLYMTYEEQDYWRFITTWNYSLTFNGNGATSGTPGDQTGTKKEDESFTYTLPANPTRTNYTFNNWSDGSSTYTAGNTITLTKDDATKTLTANWTEQTWTYTLSYNLNGGKYNNSTTISKTTGTAGKATSPSKNVSVKTTSSSNPSKDGYTFLGWSTNSSATAADSGLGVGQTATVTLTTSSPSKTLYAVWKANKTYFQTVGTTQAEAQNWCKSLTIWTESNNTEYILYDNRDEKGYLVRRLADGNCWMAQNLALNGGKTITPDDSNVTSNYTLPTSANPSTNGWSTTNNSEHMWNGTHIDGENDTAITEQGTASENTGAYYTFQAATAGTLISSGDASQSICPKWWHIPSARINNKKEFDVLTTAYGDSAKVKTALGITSTGRCDATACPNNGESSFHLSSSTENGSRAWIIYGGTGTASIQKIWGSSVRCMLTGGLD